MTVGIKYRNKGKKLSKIIRSRVKSNPKELRGEAVTKGSLYS